METLNKKIEMFQTTVVKGLIEDLTGNHSMLATKIDIDANIENLNTTMDTIKQLIIDTAKMNRTNIRRTSKQKTATQNLENNQESDISDI